MPPEDPYALVGSMLERRFAVESAVARGGFGVVYRATQPALRRPVALKVLSVPSHLTPEQRHLFLEGFAREAQTIAALDHPAIVRVFDFGVSAMPGGEEAPWMALEWIEGTPLSAAIKARGGRPMSPAEALHTLRPVFEALAFAHESGVAHRDVKPSNIMLTSPRGAKGGALTARLLDFGIAKLMGTDGEVGTGETRTEGRLTAFSLPYAAPEQRAELRTGPWTDVHALGLILTELLTGRRPYPSSHRFETEVAILSEVRPTPGRFGVDVGPWEAVIARAVALRPPSRFADAGAFLAALEAHVPTAVVVAPNERGDTEPVAVGPFVPPTVTVPPVASTTPPPSPPRRLALTSVLAAALTLVVLVAAFVRTRETAERPTPTPASGARTAPTGGAPGAVVQPPPAQPPPTTVTVVADGAAPTPSASEPVGTAAVAVDAGARLTPPERSPRRVVRRRGNVEAAQPAPFRIPD